VALKKNAKNEGTKEKPANRQKNKAEKELVYIAADIPDSTSQKAKIARGWAHKKPSLTNVRHSNVFFLVGRCV